MLRFVQPATTVLHLSDGETLTVRTRLTHGEYLAMFDRMYRDAEPGQPPRPDPKRFLDAIIVAYLVEWSARGPDGAPLPIRGLGPDEVQDLLNSMEQSSIREMKAAIEQHDAATTAAGEALKKTDGDGRSSLATLSSVA